jgi:hypothetical protein
MCLRAAGTLWVLLAIGCSDGAEPGVAPSGQFTAQLTGSQTLHLAGSASTSTSVIGTDTVYWVGMLETISPAETRAVILSCRGHGQPGVGTHSIGHASECQGTYFRTIGAPSIGVSREDGLDADTGSVTITRRSDQQLQGSFTLEGQMTSFGNPAGPLTVTGTFVAVPMQ